jgi:hypothetical protein
VILRVRLLLTGRLVEKALCILGMRLCAISESQQQNVKKLLDLLPSIGNNEQSVNGPMMACDHGCGKLPVMKALAKEILRWLLYVMQLDPNILLLVPLL